MQIFTLNNNKDNDDDDGEKKRKSSYIFYIFFRHKKYRILNNEIFRFGILFFLILFSLSLFSLDFIVVSIRNRTLINVFFFEKKKIIDTKCKLTTQLLELFTSLFIINNRRS